MLGIFDSGLGGLTVLRAVRARLPAEDIVYLADQAHVPYGGRTDDDLLALLADNVRVLESAGVDAIVMGCNTTCAVAARRGWPATALPVIDLIASAAAAVASDASLLSIGVVATVATARSGAYGDAIRKRVPRARVHEVGVPELVPLVEAGIRDDDPQVLAAIDRARGRLPHALDAVVLGCTHFPVFDTAFAAVFGGAIHRIDPASVQAERATAFARDGSGSTRFLTSGEPARFALGARAILGSDVPVAGVERVPVVR